MMTSKILSFLPDNYNENINKDSYNFIKEFNPIENNIIETNENEIVLDGLVLSCIKYQFKNILVICNQAINSNNNYASNFAKNSSKFTSHTDLIELYKKYVPFSNKLSKLKFTKKSDIDKIIDLQFDNREWFKLDSDKFESNPDRNEIIDKYDDNFNIMNQSNIYNVKWDCVIIMNGNILNNQDNKNELFQSIACLTYEKFYIILDSIPESGNDIEYFHLMCCNLLKVNNIPSIDQWEEQTLGTTLGLIKKKSKFYKIKYKGQKVSVRGSKKSKKRKIYWNEEKNNETKKHKTVINNNNNNNNNNIILFNNNNNNNINNINNNLNFEFRSNKKHYQLVAPDVKNFDLICSSNKTLFETINNALKSQNYESIKSKLNEYRDLINSIDNVKNLTLSKYVSMRLENSNQSNLNTTEKCASIILSKSIDHIIVSFSNQKNLLFCNAMFSKMNISEYVKCILFKDFDKIKKKQKYNQKNVRIIFFDPFQFNDKLDKKNYLWILKQSNWSICWLSHDFSIEKSIIYNISNNPNNIHFRGKIFAKYYLKICCTVSSRYDKYHDEELNDLLNYSNGYLVNTIINNNYENNNKQLGHIYNRHDIDSVLNSNQQHILVSNISSSNNNNNNDNIGLPIGSQIFVLNINDYQIESKTLQFCNDHKVSFSLENIFYDLIAFILKVKNKYTKVNKNKLIIELNQKIKNTQKAINLLSFQITEPLNILKYESDKLKTIVVDKKKFPKFSDDKNYIGKKIGCYYSKPEVIEKLKKIIKLRDQLKKFQFERNKIISRNRALKWIINNTNCTIDFRIITDSNNNMSCSKLGHVTNFKQEYTILNKSIKINNDLILTMCYLIKPLKDNIIAFGATKNNKNFIYEKKRHKILKFMMQWNNNHLINLGLIAYCIPQLKSNHIISTVDSIIIIFKNHLIGYSGKFGFKLLEKYLIKKINKNMFITFDLIPKYSAETIKQFSQENNTCLEVHTTNEYHNINNFSENWVKISIFKKK